MSPMDIFYYTNCNIATSAESPLLGPALTILVYPPTFLPAYLGAISLNNFAGTSILLPSMAVHSESDTVL